VRASTKALTTGLLEVPGGEELLLAARWYPTTFNHQKYFVFDREEEHSLEVLKAVGDCVEKVQTHVSSSSRALNFFDDVPLDIVCSITTKRLLLNSGAGVGAG
jgi:hypothetical protein